MDNLKIFVKHIEHNLLENRTPLTKKQMHQVVQFNVERKQLIDQLLSLLREQKTNIGKVFEQIQFYLGMHIFKRPNVSDKCIISNTECSNGRYVCLMERISNTNQKIHTSADSFDFYVRSDFIRILKDFYLYQHFGYYVMVRIFETTVEERWQDDSFCSELFEILQCCRKNLMLLIRPLEYDTKALEKSI